MSLFWRESQVNEKLRKLDLWVPSLNEKEIETYRKKTEQRKRHWGKCYQHELNVSIVNLFSFSSLITLVCVSDGQSIHYN